VGVHGVAADQEAVERQGLEERPGGQRLVLATVDRPARAMATRAVVPKAMTT
jgi:hypothetical protein